MWKIGGFSPTVKRKVDYLHSRIPCTLHKLYYRRCEVAKVFSYHIHLSKHFLHPCKECKACSLLPFTHNRIFSSIRNGIIGVKSPKMVYSYSIVKVKCPCHTLHPPVVARLLVIIPVIERIAPELARC